MLLKKYSSRRYEIGGGLPYDKIGMLLGDSFDQLTPTNQYGVKSNVNAATAGVLKGAGTGASIGSIVPGIGTAIGAGLGAIAGGTAAVIKNNQLSEAATKAQEAERINSIIAGNRRLLNYDTAGSNTNGIYAKFGGKLGSRMYTNGGNLTPISADSVQVNGASHEQGGVQLGQGVEVEGGETINNDFVFSEALGFADRHKKLAKQIAKVEQRPYNSVSYNTFKLLKSKEQDLKMEQEATKAVLGLPNDLDMRTGGLMKKKIGLC